MRRTATIPATALVTWLAVATPALAEQARVDFDRDVAPILSAKCLRCHGAAGPEAGLDLTSPEKATVEAESGSRAIVAGDPVASELLRRVSAEEQAERMPPIGDPLTSTEVETLRRWIEQGAVWPPHWAYRPLRRTKAPVAESGEEAAWAKAPIDLFVLRTLRDRGFTPSRPADRRTWIRRVTFDLTGLPPTPEEVAAFLADESPDVEERLVDRLLASPHYGERRARRWMDLAHYAETHGHDQDRPRPNAWPYRDYLIRSFNEDKPYARFVEEQVAGDVIRPGDPEAIVATGFLAAGPWDESSLRDIREDGIDREIARYLDRDDIVSSVLSTFASTTVGCARCHDHKFDPIPQAEYYGLQAVFAGVDKANRAYDPDPDVARRRRELLARMSALPAQRDTADPALLDPTLQAAVASWEREIGSTDLAWVVLDPETFTSANGSTLSEMPDSSLLAGGPIPETDVYSVTVQVPLPSVTGVRLEVLPDESLPQQGPGRCHNGNLHLNELSVTAHRGDLGAGTAVALRNPAADFDQAGWTAAMALDADPATAWGIFPEVGMAHRATFELAEPLTGAEPTSLTFRVEQTHGGGHLIGRFRLLATSAPLPLPADAAALPAEIAAILSTPAVDRTATQQAHLAAFYLEREIDRDLAGLPPKQFVYCGTNAFEPDGSFRPAAGPRVVNVLHRGDVREPRDVAEPGALSCLPDLAQFAVTNTTDEARRRETFARWLSDPRNVLVWRSIANRVWQHHFGRGLVDTPNDFGRMGSTPTHPELLDWLASELIATDGSLKHLDRLIVLSATYRQTSGIADFGLRNADSEKPNPQSEIPKPQSVDAENRLLWRMNRTRLDAESVRDAILSVSGELDVKMGGPGVKQFVETPGIHVTPNVDYGGFDIDDPANRRRSVYRFLFRTLPDPFMETLDCPDGSQNTAARAESVTALQALAMLNNRFVVRQSEKLAERLERERTDLPGRIGQLFELVLLREPTAGESEAFQGYAAEHGLPNACRMLLNSNEFLFVD